MVDHDPPYDRPEGNVSGVFQRMGFLSREIDQIGGRFRFSSAKSSGPSHDLPPSPGL